LFGICIENKKKIKIKFERSDTDRERSRRVLPAVVVSNGEPRLRWTGAQAENTSPLSCEKKQKGFFFL
jgi:hypothetical protein